MVRAVDRTRQVGKAMRHNRGKPAKCVNSFEVSNLDGLKEVSVGPSSYNARMNGDASKTGKASQPGVALDDAKARAERYGIDVDGDNVIGLGLF